MRFYKGTHRFYAGVDLHTKVMYVCVLDQDGSVLAHRNIEAGPEPFLRLIAPFREDVVVAAECTFSWYWLAEGAHRQTRVPLASNVPEARRPERSGAGSLRSDPRALPPERCPGNKTTPCSRSHSRAW